MGLKHMSVWLSRMQYKAATDDITACLGGHDVTQIWPNFYPHPLPPLSHTMCLGPYALLSQNALPPPPLCVTSFIDDPLLVAEHMQKLILKMAVTAMLYSRKVQLVNSLIANRYF